MALRNQSNLINIPRFSESVTELLRGLSVAARLDRRRRIYALIDNLANRLIERKGAGGARAECVRRMAFCARAAPGLRWTIWQRVHKAVKLKTGYDTSRRRRD